MPPEPRSDFALKAYQSRWLEASRCRPARMIGRPCPRSDAVRATRKWTRAGSRSVGDELETPAMQGLRAFLAAEVAAGPRLLPAGRPRLQRAAADAARGRARRDPGPGPLPRAAARRWGCRSRFRPGWRSRRRCATSSRELATDLGLPAPDHGRSHAVGRARRAAAQQRAHRRAPLARLARRQGLGDVHRPGDRRAVRPTRRDRLSPLGSLRTAEGRDRRHHAAPRPHGGASLPVLRAQRLLRLPALLPRERACSTAGGRPRGRLAALPG